MLADVAAGTFFIALVYVLVRPGARAVEMIDQFGTMLSALVSTVTETAVDEQTESEGFTGVTESGNVDITEGNIDG